MTTAPTTVSTTAIAKPVGKAEVVEAILAAASELFAEKGPQATSVREVAARAGVNHGLVHRHFGSKRQLLASTLQHLADAGMALRESGASAAELEAALDLQLRVMVRSALDGYPIEELQERRPGMRWLFEQIRPAHRDEHAAALAAAHAIALQLGWRLIGPSLRAGFDLDMSDDELRAAIAEETARILTPG